MQSCDQTNQNLRFYLFDVQNFHKWLNYENLCIDSEILEDAYNSMSQLSEDDLRGLVMFYAKAYPYIY